MTKRLSPAQVLAQSFTLPNGAVVKNRLVKSAMSESLGTYDNRPTPELARLYERWAEGGAGLLITGNVMIDRNALGEPGNVVVEDERDFARLQAWARRHEERHAALDADQSSRQAGHARAQPQRGGAVCDSF